MPRLPFSASFSRLASRPVMRLLLVAMLFFGLGGAALAGQIDADDAKDSVEEDVSATPEVSPGLAGEGEYESPQFGTEITWTDAWDLGDFDNPLVEFAVGGNFDAPITSDPVDGDVVFLMDTETESSVLNFALSENVDNLDPAIMEQALGQPDVLEENLFVSPDSEILLLDSNETSAAIMARDANDTDHIIYLSVNFVPGEDFYAWTGIDIWEPEHYESVLTAFANEVEISDFDPFEIEEVDGLIDLALSEPAPATPDVEPTEVDETPDAEPTEDAQGTPATVDGGEPASDSPGLVGEGEYESPQHGTGITWTDAWVLDETRDEPVVSDVEEGFDALFLADAATGNATVYLSVEELPSSDPAELLNQITADDYNEKVFGIDPESRVLLSEATDDSAAILVVDNSGADPLVIVMEAHVLNDDGLVAFVELRANAADIDEAVLTAMAEDLEIEGTPALTVFTVEELLEEVEGI